MNQAIKSFAANESGLETVEYAVMTALISVTLIGAAGLLIGAIIDRYDEIIEIL